MKMILFEKWPAFAGPDLVRNASVAKGDLWKHALKKRQDCIVLFPGGVSGIMLARLHWVAKPMAEAIEAPAGFLGLQGDAVYLDEVSPRRWWKKLFRN